jgi:hypothetical protein
MQTIERGIQVDVATISSSTQTTGGMCFKNWLIVLTMAQSQL